MAKRRNGDSLSLLCLCMGLLCLVSKKIFGFVVVDFSQGFGFVVVEWVVLYCLVFGKNTEHELQ